MKSHQFFSLSALIYEIRGIIAAATLAHIAPSDHTPSSLRDAIIASIIIVALSYLNTA